MKICSAWFNVIFFFFICLWDFFPSYKLRRQNQPSGSQQHSALMFRFTALLHTQKVSISNLRSLCFIAADSLPPQFTFLFNSQKLKCLAAFCLPWIKVNNHFFWHQSSHFQSDYFIQLASYDLSIFSLVLIDHCLILFFLLVALEENSVKQP